MIKRILVTTDGSEASEIGVRYAVNLAGKQGASLLALHVVDVKLLEGPFLRDLTASLGAAPYVNYQGGIAMLLDERGNVALSYAVKLCEQRKIPCETSLQTGIVHRVICETAELVDMVVMGRAGEHNQFLEGLIGSTTEAVVRRVSVPVLVTGQDMPGADHFMLAYDGSTQARKALRLSAEYAESKKRKICLLVVGEKQADILLEEARDYLQNRAVDVVFEKRGGDPGEEIVAFSAECDAGIIIMGAYGHSKLWEMVLGSTTTYVINHTPRPVLLVR
jgi:nucleotide-binding universal stress UspA family protein